MSKIISIQTQLQDKDILKECLEELDCQVLEQPQGVIMPGSTVSVQVLVHSPFGPLGFRQGASGTYKMVCDDIYLPRQQEWLKQLTQQYACRKIIRDTKAAGYQLVHEEVGEDRTIRLVVRKWS
ncbi:hypothetical protein CSB45_08805 [candidate division KSB3 bacterium]|uniref:DUF1257 domain-containing protein n=1 Tax=candidate division KSB3 bacterium TaxID=2044937 RepID=A0A2G6E4M2_9BACT|nr:MAG: hypothetical protein CSB45_08805 [candidate division KSB3 bacterium]PIE29679.1 MAG: hypothetical protein CSA57_07630 [candidate division KSB3 bacterium]